MAAEEEKDEPQRELNWLLAGLLVGIAGTVGGTLGIFTVWTWSYAVNIIFGPSKLTFSLSLILLAFAFCMGILGALFAGGTANRYLDKYEGRPEKTIFRDNKNGGIVTRIIRGLIWTAFLFIAGTIATIIVKH